MEVARLLLTVSAQVICQVANFAVAHSERYYNEPRKYRPQRWLPEDHPEYDHRFDDDNKKGHLPFGQGPRACPGSSVAWMQTRLFIAKLLWSFDIELVPGQDLDWDRDFRLYAMLEKPKLYVKFRPVVREK